MSVRFGIRGTSHIHCTLYRESTAVYDVTTCFYPRSVTSIIRDGTVVAKIEWSRVGRWRSKVTIEGQTGTLDNLLPRAGTFTKSREYHSSSGKVLKWKVDNNGTLCVDPHTNRNFAHYNGISMTRAVESCKASILHMFDGTQYIQDAIVVTWVMMETMTRGQNPASTPGIRNSARQRRGVLGGGGDGGSWGSDGGCGDGGGGGGGD